jgi:hypothetical protein
MDEYGESGHSHVDDRSILSDPPAEEQSNPSLDDIMPDPLVANQRVFVQGRVVEFLYKEKHGPHVYFDTGEREQFSLHTADIVKLKPTGDYVVPGGAGPIRPQVPELDEAERKYLRMSLGSVRRTPRRRGSERFLYVGHYLSKIYDAQSQGQLFARNEENAALVVKEVDAIITARNAEEPDPAKHIVIPRRRQPRTVLDWVAKEINEGLGEVGQVHRNALNPHDRKLPERVFDIILETIREAISVSGKMTPTKVYNLTCGKIKELNDL